MKHNKKSKMPKQIVHQKFATSEETYKRQKLQNSHFTKYNSKKEKKRKNHTNTSPLIAQMSLPWSNKGSVRNHNCGQQVFQNFSDMPDNIYFLSATIQWCSE